MFKLFYLISSDYKITLVRMSRNKLIHTVYVKCLFHEVTIILGWTYNIHCNLWHFVGTLLIQSCLLPFPYNSNAAFKPKHTVQRRRAFFLIQHWTGEGEEVFQWLMTPMAIYDTLLVHARFNLVFLSFPPFNAAVKPKIHWTKSARFFHAHCFFHSHWTGKRGRVLQLLRHWLYHWKTYR